MYVYMATSGDDGNDGSKKNPVKTVERVCEIIRKIDKTTEREIEVHIESGVYYLEKTLVLSELDSGTLQCPISFVGKGEVVFSGARNIIPNWERYNDQIVRTKVPDGVRIDQVFLNHQQKIMARYPNFDADAKYYNGYSSDSFSPERVQHYKNPKGGYMHVMHQALWGGFHYEITGKNLQNDLEYVGGWQNNRPSKMHESIRFIENIFEELDAPNEWYYNEEERMLYYIPNSTEELNHSLLEVVELKSLLRIEGTSKETIKNLTFQNITFTHVARTFMEEMEQVLQSDWCIYRGGAIYLNNAELITIKDCKILEVGGNGITISGYNSEIAILDCEVNNAGASSILVVGELDAVKNPRYSYSENFADDELVDWESGAMHSRYPKDCLIRGNLLTRNGRIEKQSAGVSLAVCERINVQNNTIYDVPRAGINICNGCFGGHIIEGNIVFDTVKETHDHGAFNSWGRDRYWDFRYEVMQEKLRKNPQLPLIDAFELVVLRRNVFECSHGWDIDLDDGSSNYLIEENLCLRGGIKNREGVCREVRNNLMYQNTFHPHVWYENSLDSFHHNIIYAPYKDIRLNGWGELYDYNILVSNKEEDVTLLQEKSNMDNHSIACNLRLKNVENGDFSVQDEKLLEKMRIVPIDVSGAGVINEELKKKAKSPYEFLKESSLEKKTQTKHFSNEKFSCQGLNVEKLMGEEEVSAVGMYDKIGYVVKSVEESSKWYGFGIRTGDVLLELNGKLIERADELEKQKYLNSCTIWRNQTKEQLLC